MSNPPIRHALITGGSRGIGLSIAQLFARNSYRCTLVSRSATSLEAAVSTLDTSHLPSPYSHSYTAGDVSSPSFWNHERNTEDPSIFSRRYNGDKIDVVINCAGITQSSLFSRTKADRIKEIVDTNLTGMMIGTRYLLRHGHLRRKSEGFSPVIINVSSLLGVKGGIGAVAYAASKAGVLGFTRALAEELSSSGVRVNAIVPGYISTDMTAGKSFQSAQISSGHQIVNANVHRNGELGKPLAQNPSR